MTGGQTALARRLGVKQGHVWKWLNKSPRGVPAEFVLPIYRVTNGGVTPHDLRPDLFVDPSWLPPLGSTVGGGEKAA